ncbi:MAG TPA: DUF4856 domain-containing protein [Flavobacteriales bacterium]|nr:DUF4856 domain-containing protein [Flavobacteriales bacterium]
MPLMISTPLKQLIGLALCTSVSFTFSSCNQDDDDQLEIPTTYEFSRDGSSTVDFSGQTERLDMLAQLSTYLKTSNTVGAPALNENTLKDMFRNENTPFQVAYGKNLISKCFGPDTTFFLEAIEAAALASQAQVTASEGIAGVLVEGSNNPLQGYRVNENGLELIQVIEKGLMGAVFYYQAMEVYLSQERMADLGNDDLVAGKNYTNMEHYFDEAFGYFGAPIDFPSTISLEDARFWATYCNRRNGGLYNGINDEISNAFRTARAAIVAKDYEARDEAIQVVMDKWSIVIASTVVDYFNQGLTASGNAEYVRHHALSEAVGFMLGLKYHFSGGNSKFPPRYAFSHVEQALDIVGMNTNFYTLTDADLEEAIGHIKMAFPSGEIK